MESENTVGSDGDGIDWSGNQVFVAEQSDIVRPASPSDIGDIAMMTRDIEGENWSWKPNLIARDLSYFFVEGDPVHGFIRVEPWGDGLLVLTLIAVKPDWQRKGVATRLLEALDSIAEAFDAKQLVNCGPKTPEVFKLYEKLGWEDAGRTPQGYVILTKDVKHESVEIT